MGTDLQRCERDIVCLWSLEPWLLRGRRPDRGRRHRPGAPAGERQLLPAACQGNGLQIPLRVDGNRTAHGRQQRQVRSDAIAAQSSHFIFLGQEIGFGYWDSPLVTPDGSPHYADEHDVEDPISTYVANARPGARAPHCWLQQPGQQGQFSILDLFDTGFTLLTTPGNQPQGISATAPVTTYTIGEPGSQADLIDASGDWRRC